MRLTTSLITLSVTTLILATDASAEPTATQVQSAAAPFSLPDLATARSAGAEFAFIKVGDGDDDLTSMVLTLAGHFEITPSLQIEARVPIARASEEENSETDLGNIAVGAQYLHRAGLWTAGGGARVYLPTAPELDFISGDDNGAAALTAAFAQFDRLSEFFPSATTYSAHGDLRYDDGRVFAQAQVAFDIVQTDAGADDDESLELIRVGVAGGIRATPALSVVAEFTTLSAILEDSASDDEEKTYHWTRLGVRHQFDRLAVGAHLYVPLDSPTEDTIGGGIDVSSAF